MNNQNLPDLHLSELKVINLAPGDVLSVKLTGDVFDFKTVESVKTQLERVFPKNKVIVFAIPYDSDILFEAISPSESGDDCC